MKQFILLILLSSAVATIYEDDANNPLSQLEKDLKTKMVLATNRLIVKLRKDIRECRECRNQGRLLLRYFYKKKKIKNIDLKTIKDKIIQQDLKFVSVIQYAIDHANTQIAAYEGIKQSGQKKWIVPAASLGVALLSAYLLYGLIRISKMPIHINKTLDHTEEIREKIKNLGGDLILEFSSSVSAWFPLDVDKQKAQMLLDSLAYANAKNERGRKEGNDVVLALGGIIAFFGSFGAILAVDSFLGCMYPDFYLKKYRLIKKRLEVVLERERALEAKSV